MDWSFVNGCHRDIDDAHGLSHSMPAWNANGIAPRVMVTRRTPIAHRYTHAPQHESLAKRTHLLICFLSPSFRVCDGMPMPKRKAAKPRATFAHNNNKQTRKRRKIKEKKENRWNRIKTMKGEGFRTWVQIFHGMESNEMLGASQESRSVLGREWACWVI